MPDTNWRQEEQMKSNVSMHVWVRRELGKMSDPIKPIIQWFRTKRRGRKGKVLFFHDYIDQ